MSIPSYTDKDFYVKVTESSLTNKILPSVLLGDFQEIAEEAVLSFGVDSDNLNEKGYCWIVLRMSVEIDRFPSWKELFKLRTWSCGTESLFWRRDYKMIDKDNNVFGRSTSEWIVADMNTHRPVRPSTVIEDFKEFPDYASLSSPQNDDKALDYSSPKLSFPKDFSVFDKVIMTKYADYSELDHNHHVNNTRYIAWAYDALYKMDFDVDSIKKFDIVYQSEVKSGEKVDLYYLFDGEYHYIYGYKNEKDKVYIFRCKCE